MSILLEENFLIPENKASFAFVSTCVGLVESRSIFMPEFGSRTTQSLYKGTVCVPDPTQPDTEVAGVRKWGARLVMTLVHWEPVVLRNCLPGPYHIIYHILYNFISYYIFIKCTYLQKSSTKRHSTPILLSVAHSATKGGSHWQDVHRHEHMTRL